MTEFQRLLTSSPTEIFIFALQDGAPVSVLAIDRAVIDLIYGAIEIF